MNFLKELLKKEMTKRLLVLALLVAVLYLMRTMLNMFLLTFLFTYIVYSLQTFIINKASRLCKLNETVVTLILYIFLVFSISFAVTKYVPLLAYQIKDIISEIKEFDFDSVTHGLISKYVLPQLSGYDFSNFTKNGVSQVIRYATNVGKISFDIFVAFILSLFFMLERKKVKIFFSRFNNSRVSVIYKYTKDFCQNFLNSFGKVIQAQIIIAIVNSILSVICLSILGFTQALGLGLMIFFFSLVPVAGTIASLIPLSVIAFGVGGFREILYVIIMIVGLHALESYVLNPKLMADKTELPVFVIFIILIVSHNLMGIWGLLIGVPLFMFILDFLNIKTDQSLE